MKFNKRIALLGLLVLLATMLLLSLNTFPAQAVTDNEPNFNDRGSRSYLQANGFEVNNNAEIAISVAPSVQAIQLGETAKFTVTITNTGTVALGNIVVTDALVPDCNFTMSSLNPGSGSSQTCAKSNVTEDFTNVAVVTAEALDNPEIKITKSASAEVKIFSKKVFLPLIIK